MSLGTTSFTIFDTSITTVTEPTPTSTVPTSSGFTYPSPIPSETTAQKKRAARYEARPEKARRDATAEKRGTLNSGMVQQAHLDLVQGTVKHSPAQYPTSVLCTDIIKVLSTSTVVRTAKPTTTTVPGSTITSTITTVITSTQSNYESFTAVTVSTTQTGTVLSYITSTVTTTYVNNSCQRTSNVFNQLLTTLFTEAQRPLPLFPPHRHSTLPVMHRTSLFLLLVTILHRQVTAHHPSRPPFRHLTIQVMNVASLVSRLPTARSLNSSPI